MFKSLWKNPTYVSITIILLIIVWRWDVLIYQWPILPFPSFFVFPMAVITATLLASSVILSIATALLEALGVPEERWNKQNRPFFGKNIKKTVTTILIIVLVAGLIMFFKLHKYY